MVDVIRGVVEDVVGKAKEVVGTVAGRNDWITEGQAQQDKAEALRNASKKAAEADKARAEAKVHKARQRAEQN
ncbi:MAG: CsbD family protein [Actinomycetota bacterium]|uniref:CsbD family protein n=1 Tax=Mycobacterium lentiflavum TaxID=141349 RepID=A0ABY3UND8_MYCLN|nr:CsbD family protein [Mycobacterium lentiflavum]MEE3065037.1 CsbD family protein [Actinomycetota bacterium]ULP41123.1 CsbD family protein [Mycobacterium lentiflavum]